MTEEVAIQLASQLCLACTRSYLRPRPPPRIKPAGEHCEGGASLRSAAATECTMLDVDTELSPVQTMEPCLPCGPQGRFFRCVLGSGNLATHVQQ